MTKDEVKEAAETSRMWASASFVGVLIIIGLPLWWKTTEVYRVALPYDEINAFDTDSHYINSTLVVHANDEETAADIAAVISKTFAHSDVIKLTINLRVIPKSLQHTLDQVADELEALEEVGEVLDIQRANTFHVVQRTQLFQDVWVGAERVAFYRDKKAASTLAEVLSSWIYQPSVLEGARALKADAHRQLRFPPEPHLDIVLTVVHPRPQELKVEFDAAEAVEDYIGSFVDELSELHNFTLKSQWLHLMEFDFQSKLVSTPSGARRLVSVERLPLLLTSLDGRGLRPAVRLAAYVLPCHHETQAPLALTRQDEIVETPVLAFMSPKWGGVVLLSPSSEECARGVYEPDVKLVMGTFVSQLRKLLGITDKPAFPSARLAPLRVVSPRRWELDALLRLRTLEQLTDAQTSLKSLAKLLGEIPNIVITDEVGAHIHRAVRASAEARLQGSGGDLRAAHEVARHAARDAEIAFTEPSLLALLYFPDDQKYAIYIPLFLPIMFPVILSLKNLILWFRRKPDNKEKTD